MSMIPPGTETFRFSEGGHRPFGMGDRGFTMFHAEGKPLAVVSTHNVTVPLVPPYSAELVDHARLGAAGSDEISSALENLSRQVGEASRGKERLSWVSTGLGSDVVHFGRQGVLESEILLRPGAPAKGLIKHMSSAYDDVVRAAKLVHDALPRA